MKIEEIIHSPFTAMLVLDVQNDFCHPKGEVGRLGLDLSHVPEFIHNLTLLIEEARKSKIPIIFTRDIHSNRFDSEVWIEKHTRDGKSPFPREGSWGAELITEIIPKKDELTIIKHRYSAFINTGLHEKLKRLRISNLIVTGLYTQVCVESTVRHAHMLDYRVLLPKECIMKGSRKIDQEIHENSLQVMDYYFASVIPLSTLFRLLEKRSSFLKKKGCNIFLRR